MLCQHATRFDPNWSSSGATHNSSKTKAKCCYLWDLANIKICVLRLGYELLWVTSDDERFRSKHVACWQRIRTVMFHRTGCSSVLLNTTGRTPLTLFTQSFILNLHIYTHAQRNLKQPFNATVFSWMNLILLPIKPPPPPLWSVAPASLKG